MTKVPKTRNMISLLANVLKSIAFDDEVTAFNELLLVSQELSSVANHMATEPLNQEKFSAMLAVFTALAHLESRPVSVLGEIAVAEEFLLESMGINPETVKWVIKSDMDKTYFNRDLREWGSLDQATRFVTSELTEVNQEPFSHWVPVK